MDSGEPDHKMLAQELESARMRISVLEGELERERETLRAVFESTPDLFVLKDRNSVYRAVNPAFCRFLGKGAEEIIGRSDHELFPPEDARLYVRGDAEVMASGRPEIEDWEAVLAGIEGSRALLVEVQALVSRTGYSMPQRISTGFDLKRIAIILAVLEKRLQYQTATQDVFVKIAGGLRLVEPAADLAVAAAIASGLRNTPCSPTAACCGEIGLSGELRAISDGERRIREAVHLGFASIVMPAANTKELKPSTRKLPIRIVGCRTLHEALEAIDL